MHFGNLHLIVAASFAVISSATPLRLASSAPSPLKPSVSTQCFARNGWGNGLANTQTTWSTQYTSCTSTSTSTVTQTTTSSPVTTTSTSVTTTTVTAPTLSFTATDTSTVIVSTTITSTETYTTTSTTTSTSTATSTAPTLAGFLPIQSSLPGATYNGPAGPVKRGFGGFNFGSKPANSGSKSVDSGLFPAQSLNRPRYPKGFACISYAAAKCSTSVATTAVVYTIPGQSTITMTTTSTDTTTIVPSATTTVTTTVSTTSTSIESTITTTTATATSSVTTTTTVYAACATNNLANLYNNKGLYHGQGDFMASDFSTQNSAYDCCVAALTHPSAGIQAWVWAQDGTKNCVLAYTPGTTAPTCAQAASKYDIYLGETSLVIGNGYCGEFTVAI